MSFGRAHSQEVHQGSAPEHAHLDVGNGQRLQAFGPYPFQNLRCHDGHNYIGCNITGCTFNIGTNVGHGQYNYCNDCTNYAHPDHNGPPRPRPGKSGGDDNGDEGNYGGGGGGGGGDGGGHGHGTDLAIIRTGKGRRDGADAGAFRVLKRSKIVIEIDENSTEVVSGMSVKVKSLKPVNKK